MFRRRSPVISVFLLAVGLQLIRQEKFVRTLTFSQIFLVTNLSAAQLYVRPVCLSLQYIYSDEQRLNTAVWEASSTRLPDQYHPASLWRSCDFGDFYKFSDLLLIYLLPITFQHVTSRGR